MFCSNCGKAVDNRGVCGFCGATTAPRHKMNPAAGKAQAIAGKFLGDIRTLKFSALFPIGD